MHSETLYNESLTVPTFSNIGRRTSVGTKFDVNVLHHTRGWMAGGEGGGVGGGGGGGVWSGQGAPSSDTMAMAMATKRFDNFRHVFNKVKYEHITTYMDRGH